MTSGSWRSDVNPARGASHRPTILQFLATYSAINRVTKEVYGTIREIATWRTETKNGTSQTRRENAREERGRNEENATTRVYESNVRVHVSSIWRMKRNSPFRNFTEVSPSRILISRDADVTDVAFLARHPPSSPLLGSFGAVRFRTRSSAEGSCSRIGRRPPASGSLGLLSWSLISQIACNLPSLSRRYPRRVFRSRSFFWFQMDSFVPPSPAWKTNPSSSADCRFAEEYFFLRRISTYGARENLWRITRDLGESVLSSRQGWMKMSRLPRGVENCTKFGMV